MAAGNILIAEDDAVLRNLYVKKFQMAGFTIRIAENGEQTVTMLREQIPDLLLLDLHMPKLDGFQVLEQFPKETRTFGVIVLTNFDEQRYKDKAKELGADDYFVKKDMTIRTLLDMTDRVLRSKTQ